MYRYIVIIGLLSSLKSYSQSIDISKNWLVSIDDTLDWASGSFNGKLVGQTGSMPPNSIGVDRGKRIYKVDAKEVHWDQENQIAVRIFSNFHNGGLWGENFNIIFPSENIFHSAEKNISGFPWPKGQKSYEASTKVSISYKEEALKAGGLSLKLNLPEQASLFYNGKYTGKFNLSGEHSFFISASFISWGNPEFNKIHLIPSG